MWILCIGFASKRALELLIKHGARTDGELNLHFLTYLPMENQIDNLIAQKNTKR